MSKVSVIKTASKGSTRHHSKVDFKSSTAELYTAASTSAYENKGLLTVSIAPEAFHVSSVTSFDSAKVEMIPTSRRSTLTPEERHSLVNRITASILKQTDQTAPDGDTDHRKTETPEQTTEEKEVTASASQSDTHK